jgi:hypothetical protein
MLSTRRLRGSFTLGSTGGKQCQFDFRDGKPRTATIQTDRKFREYPDARIIQIFGTSDVDDHLSGKIRLMT